MSTDNPEQKLPKYSRSLISTVLSSLELIIFGVFLLVVVFKPSFLGNAYPISVIWLPATLALVWLLCLTHSLLLRNTVTFWLSFVFLTCLAAWYIHNFFAVPYAKIYPIYVAIPAIASAATLLFAKDKSVHLKSVIFFGGIALVLFINSLFGVDWWIIGPIAIIMAGGFIFVNAITSRKGRWDDGDRPQRETPIEISTKEDKEK